jgi:hypothetical protein
MEHVYLIDLDEAYNSSFSWGLQKLLNCLASWNVADKYEIMACVKSVQSMKASAAVCGYFYYVKLHEN